MALRKISLHTSALTLAPTPYMIGSVDPNDIWGEGVRLFYHWLCSNFSADKVIGEFEVAAKLNVHRLIVDEWMCAVYTNHAVKCLSVRFYETSCFGFRIDGKQRPTPLDAVTIDLAGLDTYDPWEDRSLDDSLPDAIFADHFVDKFFEVFSNEYMILNKKPRVRPNRRYFQPIDMAEYLKLGQRPSGSPPVAWKEKIDSLVSGDKSTMRV